MYRFIWLFFLNKLFSFFIAGRFDFLLSSKLIATLIGQSVQILINLQQVGVYILVMLLFHETAKNKRKRERERVYTSSTKAEYRVMSSVCYEIIWLQTTYLSIRFSIFYFSLFHIFLIYIDVSCIATLVHVDIYQSKYR